MPVKALGEHTNSTKTGNRPRLETRTKYFAVLSSSTYMDNQRCIETVYTVKIFNATKYTTSKPFKR